MGQAESIASHYCWADTAVDPLGSTKKQYLSSREVVHGNKAQQSPGIIPYPRKALKMAAFLSQTFYNILCKATLN